MAVRSFDVRDVRSAPARPVESPLSRRDRRRRRQRISILAAALVAVPFAGALVALGVAH
jgi:hypothetical protein